MPSEFVCFFFFFRRRKTMMMSRWKATHTGGSDFVVKEDLGQKVCVGFSRSRWPSQFVFTSSLLSKKVVVFHLGILGFRGVGEERNLIQELLKTSRQYNGLCTFYYLMFLKIFNDYASVGFPCHCWINGFFCYLWKYLNCFFVHL